MGQLPAARLKPAPPFTHVMLDLFGPYVVREVQKRVSGKAHGVVFTDLVFGAVHIEAVYGYDTPLFLMTLSRFASVRGWPSCIYSDPGSQLVGADRELKEAWNKIDCELLHKDCAHNVLTWHFGPADSPWNQGKVEYQCSKLLKEQFILQCTTVVFPHLNSSRYVMKRLIL